MQQTGTIRDVTEAGVCVGCGACAVASPAIRMRRNEFQAPVPDLTEAGEADISLASRVCPFSDHGRNPDEIAGDLFGKEPFEDDVLGRYTDILAGRVRDERHVRTSSAGGLTSWLSEAMLARGLIDGVIHVGRSEDGPDLFAYQVSHSAQKVRERRKSMYYAVSFDDVLNLVRGNGRRYLFVGVPCFVRAVRLLCERDHVLARQICFTAALICGHMKTPAFAELLAWQNGVSPGQLGAVDFRIKQEGQPAWAYHFGAKADIAGSEWKSQRSGALFGANWGHAAFQLGACDYCDDIFGETADIALGDAWIDPYKQDWRGTNILVSRNRLMSGLLHEGHQAGELRIEEVSPEDACRTQEGNFRHRREGLSVRLAMRPASGGWTPTPRMQPGAFKVSARRRRIIALRTRMARESHTAFLEARTAGDLGVYMDRMRPLADQMARLQRPSPVTRLAGRLAILLKRLAGAGRRTADADQRRSPRP